MKNIKADTAKRTSDGYLADTLGAKARKENELIEESIKRAKIDTAASGAALAGVFNEEAFQKDVGKASPWARNTVQLLKDIFGTANSARSLSKPHYKP